MRYLVLISGLCLILVGCGKNEPQEQEKQNTPSLQTNKLATFVNPKPRTNKVTSVKKTNIVVQTTNVKGGNSNIVSVKPQVVPQPTQVQTTPPVDYAGEKLEDLKIRASNGDTTAQMELASRYLYGKGVEKDEAQAVQWLAMAAQSGNSAAQNRLGIMYSNGQGLQRDPTQAVYWYKMAADQNFITAQNNLGIMYAQGNGVEKDNIEAYKWLTLAGQRITNAMMFRQSIEKSMTPEQIEEARKRVEEFNQIQSQMKPQ
jgi:hypothetical protein